MTQLMVLSLAAYVLSIGALGLGRGLESARAVRPSRRLSYRPRMPSLRGRTF